MKGNTGKSGALIPLFGDIHNHCGISYGHGTLDNALENAALRLDFASITGHAGWPDMDSEDSRISHIVAFHRKGFARLRAGWEKYCSRIAQFEREREVFLFPGYEIHSNQHGDYTVVGFDHDLQLILADTPGELRRLLATEGPPDVDCHGPSSTDSSRRLPGVMLFPHHIGYRVGARGGNWESFSEELSPVVEILSMHGMAESDYTDRPFLHSMGPLQHKGTMAEGLSRGHRFGVLGNTDHHSAHPGSYGHGLTGVWAYERTRQAVWEAFYARRTWAMTGDAVRLWYALEDVPMGGELLLNQQPRRNGLTHHIEVDSPSAIDYVELVDTHRRRMVWWEDGSTAESPKTDHAEDVIVTLELGWGERGKAYNWDCSLHISGSDLLEVIPRFRGQEVVSPLDASDNQVPLQNAQWQRSGTDGVAVRCTTWGNMTNSTPSTQGISLRVVNAVGATVLVQMGTQEWTYPLSQLLEGSRTDNLGPIDSPAFRISAEHRSSCIRRIVWSAESQYPDSRWYYVRVRLKNGHWAISSPVFLE
jgi:hypothetical protein